MPAEWENHEATWIGWPHNKTDWPGKFPAIPWVYVEIVRRLIAGEIVRIIVESAEHERSARRALESSGVDTSRVEFFRFPTNRGWTRDFGPIFVRGADGSVKILDVQFTAWARYPDYHKDARAHLRAAKALRLPLQSVGTRGRGFVLEGGALDVNGRGALLVTEECLLDQVTQVRNPGMSRIEIEDTLRAALGVTTVLWLGKGITGDDTHGHVDDFARFVNARTIVLCQETNPRDVNYAALQENRERLQGLSLEDGRRPDVVALPMPGPITFRAVRLPASYANFYIANSAVLVPTFNDVRDRTALGILSELFTDRPVIGIHAVDLVWGFGTLHCLTQQQPARARS
ncbi:MAG TPA: agmatine deiminase family protein [Bacteroidota bacterium]|nr:agmatine deiminase family protein [Bacteroidota bacterium]